MAETLNKYTYTSLRRDIMLLKLQPGAVLSTARVAQEYNVSRTPAREALLTLNKIGLVDMFPKSKTVVSRINVPRLYQEWFIRKSLEVSVIPDFLGNCSARSLKELERIVDEQEANARTGDFVAYFTYDNAFHQKIFSIAGQQLAWDMIVDGNCHYNRLRALIMRGGQAQDEAVAEHRQILQAMVRRDQPLIQHLMAEHTQKIDTQTADVFLHFPTYFTSQAGT